VPVHAVLLDLDDTLYDHAATSRRATAATLALEATLVAAGLDAVQAENLRQLEDLHRAVAVGRGWIDDARVERWRRILVRFGGPPERATELAMVYRANYHRNESAVDGAVELVRAVAARGVPVAIVSNNARDEQVGKLERLGLAPSVRALVVSADHGVAKPDPRLFRIALREVGVAPDAAVHLGDAWETDIVGARAAGVRAVWFDRTGGPREVTPDVAVIRSLRPTETVVRLLLDG
jgi:putative hydrolase of the HAD superfamily